MNTKLEIERKFLVKLPLSAEAETHLRVFPSTQISQTYLIPSVEGTCERVRESSIKLLGACFRHYHHTVKSHVSSGVNSETEDDISEKKYIKLIEDQADKSKTPIIKDRYLIDWEDQVFELDIFHGAHEGLAILEIEFKNRDDLDQEIKLPSFLEIIREVTDEKEYSNTYLAMMNNRS